MYAMYVNMLVSEFVFFNYYLINNQQQFVLFLYMVNINQNKN